MDALPYHASVIVIGGGIMGCSTLYHLAELGVRDAILLERNQLTSGTTWHSAAQVRALRSSSNLTRMIQYSVDLYARLEQETGQQVGWIQEGSVSIATTPGRLDHIRRQEALAKAELARKIYKIIKQRHLTQAQAAKILGIDQPKVSALIRGRLSGFSTERLFRFLNALDRDIEIVIKKKPRSRARARVNVVAV